MQPLVQIIQLPDNNSFIAKSVDNTWFETDWHQHSEFELVLFTSGNGQAKIGYKQMEFETGDLIFIASHLPHLFRKDNKPINGIVVQFKQDCLGNQLLELPECRPVKKLLEDTTTVLKFPNSINIELAAQMKALTVATNLERIILLLQCLETIVKIKDKIITIKNEQNRDHRNFIDKIIRFTHDHLHEPLTLQQVASVAYMSVPSFCYYFKHRTTKTYIEYLNHVRVDYACQQLRETNKPVNQIGYESGFNTIPHFHRQFLKLKKLTPLQYRKTW